MTHPDSKRAKGSLRLRRSAGGGRGEQWIVRYDGKEHLVEGSETAAVAKLREMAQAAKAKS